MQKIQNKVLPLITGVVILSSAISLVAFAWVEPSQDPPQSNIAAPVNVGSVAQTKSGDLGVGKLSLNGAGTEGNVEAVNMIIGNDDLHLRSDSGNNAGIFLDDTSQYISFHTATLERMRISHSSTKSVITLGAVGSSACLEIRDTDNNGWTYCTVLNGVMTCSMTSCK